MVYFATIRYYARAFAPSPAVATWSATMKCITEGSATSGIEPRPSVRAVEEIVAATAALCDAAAAWHEIRGDRDKPRDVFRLFGAERLAALAGRLTAVLTTVRNCSSSTRIFTMEIAGWSDDILAGIGPLRRWCIETLKRFGLSNLIEPARPPGPIISAVAILEEAPRLTPQDLRIPLTAHRMLERGLAQWRQKNPDTAVRLAVQSIPRSYLPDGLTDLWNALEGRVLSAKDLAKPIHLDTTVDAVRHRVGELRKRHYRIIQLPGQGYYRPDAPPDWGNPSSS
jgi:hypothetical protein